MKKYILLVVFYALAIMSYSQYTAVYNQVLYKLEVRDSLFFNKLDSMMFIKYPCMQEKEQYVYFITVKEKIPGSYHVSVVYTKPSEVGRDINTGIYIHNEKRMIIREESNDPLFSLTKEKYYFSYKKFLMKQDKDNYDLIEMIAPEEFCIWNLSYSNNKLILLGFD